MSKAYKYNEQEVETVKGYPVYDKFERQPRRPLTELEKFEELTEKAAKFHDTICVTASEIKTYLEFENDKKIIMAEVRQAQATLAGLIREIGRIDGNSRDNLEELKQMVRRISGC